MAETKREAKRRVVIVGAGPAGLTAGLELARRGYAVTLLEAADAVGGISRTIRHNAQRIDIGGHRFFSRDGRVMDWWRSILPVQGAPAMDDRALRRAARVEPGGPDPDREDEVFLLRRRVSRIYYKRKFYDYPISFRPRTFLNMGLGTSAAAGASYLASCVYKLPEDSLENFYINRFGRRLYGMFFKGYTEKVWGRAPAQISADWGAQRVKGLSVAALVKNAAQKALPRSARRVETSLIEEFWYPKYGPGQLWETVAKRFAEAGGTLLRGRTVTALTRSGARVTGVLCADGSRYAADAVFSSMPLCELVPALGGAPEDVAAIAAGLPYRDFLTVGLLTERLALPNQTGRPTLGDIVPDCWIYVQDPGVRLGRVQIFNNWSPYMLPDPVHTVWLGLEYFCRAGDELWSMNDRDLAALASAELKRIGILEPDARILDQCVARVPKAYPAYFDTYARIGRLIEWLDGFENLYCIGRNGQHRYNNMDHSMLTAFAAVDALEGRGERAAVWTVNAEKEYHEEMKA